MSERERGVIVYPLKKEFSKGLDRYVLGINPHTDEIYLINDPEGVGYIISHRKPWRFNDHNILEKWHNVIDVLSMVDWESPIDLADAIRVFDSRLEGNFLQMHWRLTTEEPVQPDYNKSASNTIIDYARKNGIMPEQEV